MIRKINEKLEAENKRYEEAKRKSGQSTTNNFDPSQIPKPLRDKMQGKTPI